MGDEPFHDDVERAVCGGGVGAGTNPIIMLDIDDDAADGAMIAMEMEVDHFLRHELRQLGLDSWSIQSVREVPTPEMVEPSCDEHPEADFRFEEADDGAPVDVVGRCKECDSIIDAI